MPTEALDLSPPRRVVVEEFISGRWWQSPRRLSFGSSLLTTVFVEKRNERPVPHTDPRVPLLQSIQVQQQLYLYYFKLNVDITSMMKYKAFLREKEMY